MQVLVFSHWHVCALRGLMYLLILNLMGKKMNSSSPCPCILTRTHRLRESHLDSLIEMNVKIQQPLPTPSVHLSWQLSSQLLSAGNAPVRNVGLYYLEKQSVCWCF